MTYGFRYHWTLQKIIPMNEASYLLCAIKENCAKKELYQIIWAKKACQATMS